MRCTRVSACPQTRTQTYEYTPHRHTHGHTHTHTYTHTQMGGEGDICLFIKQNGKSNKVQDRNKLIKWTNKSSLSTCSPTCLSVCLFVVVIGDLTIWQLLACVCLMFSPNTLHPGLRCQHVPSSSMAGQETGI